MSSEGCIVKSYRAAGSRHTADADFARLVHRAYAPEGPDQNRNQPRLRALVTMYDIPFERPITIKLPNNGHQKQVKSAAMANQFLLDYWPQNRGRSYDQALLACTQAIFMNKPAAEARNAFLLAAIESGIYVSDDDDEDVTNHEPISRKRY